MTFQCPSQTNAFQELSRIFSTRDDRVLEIEILPPALGPFLQDGASIGITKKYLIEAFVTARHVFFENLSKPDTVPHSNGHLSKTTPHELHTLPAAASEIILLFDCEHLTACNWRKRRLAALPHSQKDMLDHAFTTELSLMTTFLCSPLHRHTKSPTLWQHRQWVLTQLVQLREPKLQEIKELLKEELTAVLRAGELHPRNYYAFSHMREIHCVLSNFGGNTEKWAPLFARDILNATLDWCLAHPADISGWMFTLYLLDAVADVTTCHEIASKVVRFALDIGWEGESLWTFVDLTVRSFSLIGSIRDIVHDSPWDALLDHELIETSNQGSDSSGQLWKTWLDKARVYWASIGLDIKVGDDVAYRN